MYKALITDLDGTAVSIASNGSDVDDKTREAIAHAIQAGKKLTCATGRDWKMVKPVIQKLGFVLPCVIEGGTRIIDPITEKTLWEKALEGGASAKIFEIFKSESQIGTLMTSAEVKGVPLGTVQSVPHHLRFIYLLGIEESAAINISNRINENQYAIAHLTPSWDGGTFVDVHVTHPEATKEHAIHIWQELENVTQAETIGVGDSGNDIPIFQSAGLKVAVGNATMDLKELADYIAPNVDAHALVHVINKFLLESKIK